jgi:hypothetical protein
MRDKRWSDAIAVGSLTFVEKVKSELGFKAAHREVTGCRHVYASRTSGSGRIVRQSIERLGAASEKNLETFRLWYHNRPDPVSDP